MSSMALTIHNRRTLRKVHDGLGWRLAQRWPRFRNYWSTYCDQQRYYGCGNRYLQMAADVPGWLLYAEARALFGCASDAPEGPMLEIGSFCGRSSVVLAGAMAERGSADKLICCDPFTGDGEPDQVGAQRKFMRALRSVRPSMSTYDTFQQSLQRAGLRDRVVPLAAYSQDAVPLVGGGFALAFIDGWHDYENTKRDFGLVGDRILAGGYVLFHDYNRIEGVRRAVDQTIGVDGRYQRISREAGSVAIFRRAA